MSPDKWGREGPGVVEGGGFRVVCLKRTALGFEPGDLLLVDPAIEPEGGELVIDSQGRVARHGGGPVRGVIIGAVRRRALSTAQGRPGPAARRPAIPAELLRAGNLPWQRRSTCGLEQATCRPEALAPP